MLAYELILAHLFGDYVLQSDWMAQRKTKDSRAALAHAALYTLPFAFITQSWPALAFILGTHFLIDRYRLARFVCWGKNLLGPEWHHTGEITTIDAPPDSNVPPGGMIHGTRDPEGREPVHYLIQRRVNNSYEVERIERFRHPWEECQATGYHPSRPVWLTTWLLIITDNAMHLLMNGLALTHLT